jgi:lipopolysaccharide export system permease protein
MVLINPMYLLQRYIAWNLFVSTLTSSIIVSFLLWISQSFRFFDFIIVKRIPFKIFFIFLSLLLPDVLMISLPFSFLIAILWTYRRLILDQEIDGMFSFGLSPLSLGMPCLGLSLIFSAVLGYITIVELPQAFQKMKDQEHVIRHSLSQAIFSPGIFTVLGNKRIYVDEQINQNCFRGFFIYEKMPDGTQETVSAQEIDVLASDDQSLKIILHNGSKHQIPLAPKKPLTIFFEKYNLRLVQNKDILKRVEKKPYERALGDLLFGQPQNIGQLKSWRSEGIQRILFPLFPISYACLASFMMLTFSMIPLWIPILFSLGLGIMLQAFCFLCIQPHNWFFFTRFIACFLVIMPCFLWLFYAQIMGWLLYPKKSFKNKKSSKNKQGLAP